MNNQESRVDKALSQEDLTVLANIKSSIDELMQMSAGGGAPSPAPVKQAQKPPVEPMPEDDETAPDKKIMMSDEAPEEIIDQEKTQKAVVTTPSDNSTTPDDEDAEENLTAAMPEESQDKLNEVARALAGALLGISKSKVKKSEPVHPMVGAIQQITNAISTQDKKIESIAKAMDSFCEAFGINEQLEIARKSQLIPEQNRKPIVNKDSDQVVKYLADILNSVKKGDVQESQTNNVIGSQASAVRKNLRNKDMYAHLIPDNFHIEGDK